MSTANVFYVNKGLKLLSQLVLLLIAAQLLKTALFKLLPLLVYEIESKPIAVYGLLYTWAHLESAF
jgi:hypothetical protein